MIRIYCDGGARGNPGPAASAFVVVDGSGKTIFRDAKFLGIATNNVAEYTALIMALEWACENAKEDVTIVLDSELVTKQMTGEYKIKSPLMKTHAARAMELRRGFNHEISFAHTLREGNKEADALVNEALDAHA
jgi:ribonuclease HI